MKDKEIKELIEKWKQLEYKRIFLCFSQDFVSENICETYEIENGCVVLHNCWNINKTKNENNEEITTINNVGTAYFPLNNIVSFNVKTFNEFNGFNK